MKTSRQIMEACRRLRLGTATAVAVLSLLAGCASAPEAAYKGDLKEVARLLDRGEVKVSDQFERVGTLLHAAARGGDVRVAKLLVERGAGVNVRDDRGETPLYAACDKRKTEMVEWLLANGARESLAVAASNGATPLLNAVSTIGFVKEGYAGLPGGLFIATPKVEDVPPDISIVEALLRAGADPNWPRTPNGNTSLHLAAWWGHSDVVSLLLSSGADPSIRNDADHTAQETARSVGKVEAAEKIAAVEGK